MGEIIELLGRLFTENKDAILAMSGELKVFLTSFQGILLLILLLKGLRKIVHFVASIFVLYIILALTGVI